jgi:H+/Cl- antiporter ClcA
MRWVGPAESTLQVKALFVRRKEPEMSFWDIVWFIFISFAFAAYLMVVFTILTDLFRDPETSGWAKAIWVVALVVLPLVTSLVYLVTRGRGMAERASRRADEMKREQDAYIKEVAVTASPADQIAQARAMLEAGVISLSEYDRLKEKALV